MRSLLTLLFVICAVGPALGKEGESIGEGIKMWVVKSTFGSFREEDEEALVKMAVAGDRDGIVALIKQGKSVPLERGIKAAVLYEDKINNLYQVFLDPDPKTPGKEIRVWAPRNFLWSAGVTAMEEIPLPSEERVVDIVPVIPFDPATLPRVPIHFPARRLSDDEVIKLSMRTQGNPVMTAWCWYDRVALNAQDAIEEMMHRGTNGGSLVKPYVVYGPIPDEHNAVDSNRKYNTWLVEIQFSLPDDPRVYTAVIHGGRSSIASCELGEDTPTLKDGSEASVKTDVATEQAKAPENVSPTPINPTASVSSDWLTGMPEAGAQATQQNKDILINFTGLSWNVYCAQMEKEVFSQSSFQKYASQNLVLVKFDFPRALNEASREGVDRRDHYSVGTFPTCILANSAGIEISRLVGYAPEGQFLKWLQANKDKESEIPKEAVSASAIQGGNHEFLLSLINAMANYDWQTLTAHMLDGQVNYFGHRHSYLGYIINDIRNDSRQFGKQNLTCYWNTFSHEVSENMIYDSVNIYAVIPERGGRTHRAMERLTVGYAYVNGETKIYSLTIKVLHS